MELAGLVAAACSPASARRIAFSTWHELGLEPMQVRDVRDEERAWLRATLRDRWGGDTVVGREGTWTPAELPALVAVDDSRERVGRATYTVTAELVTIDALTPGSGVGRRLLNAVATAARAAGAVRLRGMTTNDNLPALRLYQRTGFRLVELRPGAVDQARSKTGHIPIRDELDLVLDLGDSPAP
jgi:GNAT superfamily N-acetyltransferase